MPGHFGKIPIAACKPIEQVSAADLRVLIAISVHADAAGNAFPSMATLAELTDILRSDIPRSVRRLAKAKLLIVKPRGAPGGANSYTVQGVSGVAVSDPAVSEIADSEIAEQVSAVSLQGVSEF